jgi:hypothetical protein
MAPYGPTYIPSIPYVPSGPHLGPYMYICQSMAPHGPIWVAAVPCEEGHGCGGPQNSAAAARAPCFYSSSKIGFTLETMMCPRGCGLPLSVGPRRHRWRSSGCPYRFPHGSPPCWICQLNQRAFRAVSRATSACSRIAALTQSLLQRCLLTCLRPAAHGFACVLSLFCTCPVSLSVGWVHHIVAKDRHGGVNDWCPQRRGESRSQTLAVYGV